MKANTKKILLFCIIATVITGCIPSLHPLYNDQTLIFDEALIGKWMFKDKDDVQIWQFSKAGEKEYELRILQGEKEGRFAAHLLELDGKTYLDLYPAENKTMENLNDTYKMHLVSAHTFLKLDLNGQNLKINWFMNKLLENDPNQLKHEKVNDDKIILTASTEELQRFVIEHSKEIDPNGTEFTKMEQFFTKEDVIFEEKLLGQWQSEEGDKIFVKNIGDNNGYEITYAGCDEKEIKITAITAKIRDLTMLAVYLSEPTDNEIESGQEYLPDAFFNIEQIEPKLVLREVDYEDVAGILQGCPVSKSHQENVFFFVGSLKQ